MPAKKQNEISTKRIALTPTNFGRLRDLSRGLGVNYDETVGLLLRLALQPGEDELLAGKRLRELLNKKG